MPRPALIAPASIALLFGAASAWAVKPANQEVGPFYFTPTLDASLGYVDNQFRSTDDTDDTGVMILSPRFQLWTESQLDTYSFTYELTDYRYFDSRDDDIVDHTFNLDVHKEFNARNRANLFAEYQLGHEERGTGLSDGSIFLPRKPIKVDREIYGGDYTFGARTSRGRLRLGGKFTDHDFDNFEEFTNYFDREEDSYSATFFWRVGARTDLVADLRYREVDYDTVNPADPAGSHDSDEYNYLLGVSWQPTGKTDGSVKIGGFERDYQSAARSTDDGFSWEVDVNYRPRTYSRFNVSSSRYTEESNGLGDAVDTAMTSFSWAHDWDSQSSTNLSFEFGTEDYTSSVREDDRYDIEASYNYAARRWLDLGIGYRYEDRNSELDVFDYDRNEIFLKATLSL